MDGSNKRACMCLGWLGGFGPQRALYGAAPAPFLFPKWARIKDDRSRGTGVSARH